MTNEIRRTADGKYQPRIQLQDGSEGLGEYDDLGAAQDALIAAEAAYNNTKITRDQCPPVQECTGGVPRMVRPLVEALQFYAQHGSDNGEKARKALKILKGAKCV